MEKEEILQFFRNYISGKVRLNDLEDWVLSHLQAVLNSGEQEAIALIDQVDALLIEIGAGVASEEELFGVISRFLNDADTVRLDWSIGEAPDVTFGLARQSTADPATEAAAGFELCPHFG